MIDIWHINNINWLAELDAEEVDSLRAASSILELQAHATVFEPDTKPGHVYLLESGLVRVYRTSARGDQVTLGYVKAGEVFGELVLFSGRPRESFAITVEHSTVIKCSKAAFLDMLNNHASIAITVTTQIEDRFREIESRVEDLVFRNARSRVARIVLQLAEDFGETKAAKTTVRLHLTHAELATLAGTSRPTISIVIGEFEDEGIIVRRDGYIAIEDSVALKREANRTG